MTIEACIFDLDGVICDTSVYHFLAWTETAKSLGIQFGEDDNHQLKGVSRAGSLQYILDKGGVKLDESEFDRLMKQKNDNYLQHISELNAGSLLPGVAELLADLAIHHVKIGLGSSSKNARMVLDRLGMTKYFDVIVDGNDVKNTKPDPEVFLKGAAALNVPPGACVVFEDAPKGLEAAKAGGFKSVGVGGEELRLLADVVIPNMEGVTLSWLMNLYSKQHG